MEEEDHLKEIFDKIDEIHAPIDLEEMVLHTIQQEENAKVQIARYRSRGVKAFIVSGVLMIVLGLLFMEPGTVNTPERAGMTYTSISLILVVFFIQLEVGGLKLFKNFKNNTQ